MIDSLSHTEILTGFRKSLIWCEMTESLFYRSPSKKKKKQLSMSFLLSVHHLTLLLWPTVFHNISDSFVPLPREGNFFTTVEIIWKNKQIRRILHQPHQFISYASIQNTLFDLIYNHLTWSQQHQTPKNLTNLSIIQSFNSPFKKTVLKPFR
jgi:hypothetical protein